MNANDARFDNSMHAAFAEVFDNVSAGQDLEDRVIEKAHQMRTEYAAAVEAEADGKMRYGEKRSLGAHGNAAGASAMFSVGGSGSEVGAGYAGSSVLEGKPVSRRKLIAITLGVAGGVVAAGLGVKALIDAAAPIRSENMGAHSFGLSIALADDGAELKPGVPVAVKTVNDGIVPIVENTGHSKLFKMNLGVVGEGIEEVRFNALLDYDTDDANDTDDAMTREPGGSGFMRKVSFQDWLYEKEGDDLVSAYPVYGDPGIGYRYDLGEGAQSGRFDLDKAHNVDISVIARDEFYAMSDDPIMDLYHKLEWANPMDDPELYQSLLDEYNAAYDEVAADTGSYIAWQRKNYIAGYRAIADVLAKTTFQAEVDFDDGMTESRRWRLLPVDDLAETLSSRFDALNDAFGGSMESSGHSLMLEDLYPEWLSEAVPTELAEVRSPFHVWDFLPDEKAQADTRLAAPIFQIVEV